MKAYAISISIILCFVFNSCMQKQEDRIESIEVPPAEEILSIDSVMAIVDRSSESASTDTNEDDDIYAEDDDDYEVDYEEEYDDFISEEHVSYYFKEFKTNGKNAEDIIPQRWEIMSKAIGDLNGDEIDDMAFFTRKSFHNSNPDEYKKNSNSIILAIYWGNNDGGFTQYKLYKGLVPPEENCGVGYEDLSIYITEKRVLIFNVYIFYSCGSWSNPNYSIKYRYQDGDFYKIGYDSDVFHRATGDASKVSINYLTGKMKTTSYNMFEDSVPTKTEWGTFSKPLKTLGSQEFGTID